MKTHPWVGVGDKLEKQSSWVLKGPNLKLGHLPKII